MKKIITLFIGILITAISFGQVLNAPKGIKYKGTLLTPSAAQFNRVDATSSIQGQLNAKISADYVIEKVGSTYYARPSGSYTAYSGVNFATVIMAAMGQLTTGGNVFINEGLYDNLDVIIVPYDNITIQGAGKYLTKLKLKASADLGVALLGLIDCSGMDYFTIKDIELDGNGVNQTKIDNGSTSIALISGVLQRNMSVLSTFLTVDNCYIHDFTMSGVLSANASDGIVKNCVVENNYWANIQVTYPINRFKIDNNYCHGSSCGSINSYGTDVTITNNIITDLDQTFGPITSRVGILCEGAEGNVPTRNIIDNNKITGSHITQAIVVGYGAIDCSITNNFIYDIAKQYSYGISIADANYITIVGNKIIRMGNNAFAINLHTVTYSTVMNNDISQQAGDYGIRLEETSLYNKIIGNSAHANFGLTFVTGSTSNYALSNVLNGLTSVGVDYSLYDLVDGNILRNNYNAESGIFLEEKGVVNNARTATADGLTTGLIKFGTQNLTVTSANATYIICLPSTSAATIGQVITGQVGANGCELRVIAAQATTVYINGVTTNVEAAIPANSTFEIRCIDATHWILKVWDATGTYSAPIPDAV